ncbi:MAG: uracil phosphoribosyltransferase [Chthoniobacterales bacterium]
MASLDRISQNKQTVIEVDHPLVASKLGLLRAKGTPRLLFRSAMRELSMVLLMEAARGWETKATEIETPLRKCSVRVPARAVVLVPILRAGLGMLDGMLGLLPDAAVGHIGIYREEEMLRPVTYFSRLPPGLSAAHVVLIDPMLATGNSAVAALSLLKEHGAEKIQFVCIVACAPGIKQVQSAHPAVEIITAAIDPELNDFGFIVPGLGDAGDRYFGTGPAV